MGVFLKSDQGVIWRYLNFSAPKKGGLGKTQRELTDLEWHQKKIYLVGYLFCDFLGVNTHNFVKDDPKFENKGLHFMQNFMKLDMRKFLDPKAVTFCIWGLKTSNLGPKDV